MFPDSNHIITHLASLYDIGRDFTVTLGLGWYVTAMVDEGHVVYENYGMYVVHRRQRGWPGGDVEGEAGRESFCRTQGHSIIHAL